MRKLKARKIKCPGCYQDYSSSDPVPWKALQYHLWSNHRMDMALSHEISKRFCDGKATDEDLAAMRQMPLSINEDQSANKEC